MVGSIKGAFVSAAEPHYLSLCLDNSSSFKVNALMYQQVAPLVSEGSAGLELTLASQDQLSEFDEFAVSNIGAPAQWLSEYFSNLITREELWGYWKDGQLLATGECRLFDEHQTQYADLRMIVAELVRGQGIASRVLYQRDSDDIDWVEIAFRFGFSDQPHLIRYLKKQIGLTPKTYEKERSLTIDVYGGVSST